MTTEADLKRNGYPPLVHTPKYRVVEGPFGRVTVTDQNGKSILALDLVGRTYTPVFYDSEMASLIADFLNGSRYAALINSRQPEKEKES